jgi:hypothetical protein
MKVIIFTFLTVRMRLFTTKGIGGRAVDTGAIFRNGFHSSHEQPVSFQKSIDFHFVQKIRVLLRLPLSISEKPEQGNQGHLRGGFDWFIIPSQK